MYTGGVQVGNDNVCCLAYADDIVLISDTENNLQCLLNSLDKWCKRWQLLINTDKSNVVHFRPKSAPRSAFQFKLNGTMDLHYVSQYKYLGVVMDEFFKCKDMVEVLANSAGRALGGVIAKFRTINDMGVNTYTKLFHSCVVPVMDYCAGVWGLTKNVKAESVQHRALRYFLGVHKFAPNLAIEGDMGWETCKIRWGVEIVRL